MAETDTSRATGTTGRDVLAEACVGAAALFRERWGRGPRKCRAHWAGPDTVVLVLHDIRTRAEETLVEHARTAEVIAARTAFNTLLEPELSAIVERATRRTVSAVVGGTRLEPDVTTAVFLLGVPAGAHDAGLRERAAQAIRRAEETIAEAHALHAESVQAQRLSRERERRSGPQRFRTGA
jgi:uncharacterized protein YbcI